MNKNEKRISLASELGILIQALTWLFVALFFYTFIRVEFLLWNWKVWYQHLPFSSIWSAIFSGFRFDISSLTWLSSLILINALVPWPKVPLHLKERTLRTVFSLIHLPFIFLNMVDIEFIHFSGRRMTQNNFYLLKETNGKLSALYASYGLIITFNLLLLLTFFLVIQKVKIKSHYFERLDNYFKKWKWRIPISLCLFALFVIMARGGLQPKPLEMAHAMAISSDLRLTNLTLNSSFSTIHSIQKPSLRRLQYFNSEEEYKNLLNGTTHGELLWPWDKKPKNVILFILESFSTEYTNLDGSNPKSFTPFLDSLKKNSLYFNRSYANGRRSIEALPSILAGLPSLMDEPFLTSSYQSNFIPQLGTDLKSFGIETAFFHGGANGTMFFQEFLQRIGFSQYFGKSEFPNPEQFDDGSWGIWDGPFLKFMGDKLNSIKSPFMSVFFSLSSHHPFKVPKEYEEKLPQGPIPILQTIAYTDLMLKDFFTQFQSAPWFKETLFIFTADHISKSYRSEYQTSDGYFRVPLLLYFPGSELNSLASKIETEEPVQHIDLFPTFYDIFSIPKNVDTKLSRSLFNTGTRAVTLYLDGQELLIQGDNQLILPVRGEEEWNISPQHPLLPQWKAHRQEYINSLIENRFSLAQ